MSPSSIELERGFSLASMHRTDSPDPRLRTARVCIIGVGGLGSPAALALGAAGVGTLVLVDPDRVEASNLHRQPLYDSTDVGRPKVIAAAERLRARHPGLAIETRAERFEPRHATLLGGVDCVVDGTDTVAAKFVVSDGAVAAGVPLAHAGVLGARAQVLTVLPGRTACYRCVFEDPPPADEVPSCEAAGVLGPVVALAGALQAAEVLRVLAGTPPAFADRLLTIDCWAGAWRTIPLTRNPLCAACGPDAAGRSVAP